MIFDGFIKNFIYDPVSFIGILIFYFLLINLPISLIALFNKKSSSYVRLFTILINLTYEEDFLLNKAIREIGKLINKK